MYMQYNALFKIILRGCAILATIGLLGCTTTSFGGSQDLATHSMPEYKRAKAGDPEAQYLLALYFFGYTDFIGYCSQKRGFMWLKMSAAQGYAPAIDLLNKPGMAYNAAALENRHYCAENITP